MSFRDFVRSKEIKKYGRSYVYIERDEHLVIVMSAHNQGERYMSIKTFFEGTTYSLLFLNNPENSWYLDDSDSYGKIIQEIAENYDSKNIIFYGSSMSGYSSILFALRFNCNALSVNPQINLDLSYDLCWDELRNSFDKISSTKIALEKYCLSYWKDSVVYILHGHNPLDRENVDLFARTRSDNKKLIINTLDYDEHDNYIGNDVDVLIGTCELIYQFRNIKSSTLSGTDINKQRRKSINLDLENSSRLRGYNNCSVFWHERSSYENNREPVYFSDIGLYNSNGKLSGALCYFNGRDWELISPKLDSKYNLLKKQGFSLDISPTKLLNNEKFYQDWWARVENDSDIEVTVNNEEATLNVRNVNSKNTYISIHPDKESFLNDVSKSSKYLTFFADISVEQGSAFLTLGGRTKEEYFHSNSKSVSSSFYTRIYASEIFSNVYLEHKDFIYCRVFLSPDLKDKTVKVKNPMLVEGYFPEGLIF
ncbi:hypothetical protein [Vibrio campbellii]|uniref:hypothetical protein n=1 Tax=Vibrio campbellii TaxID=680 RepID=UPI00142E5A6E|nr:hypothetical protein [Vibrio campbellii]NIY87085.1 hypothetical protein [Vibrio campbellii]NVK67527.1 hypothetical protein [Vibrio campbellii]